MTWICDQEQRILQATRCPVDGRLPVAWDVCETASGEPALAFICACGEAVAAPRAQAEAILGGLPRLIPLRFQRGVREFAGLLQMEAAHGVPYTHIPRGPTLDQAVGRARVRVQLLRREESEIALRMTQQEA